MTQVREVSVPRYGNQTRLVLDPASFALPHLASTLADTWREVMLETRSTTSDLTTAVRAFLRHVGDQLHSDDTRASFDIEHLRRRHLDAWELHLLEEHRQAQSDTNYRRAVYLLALLRRFNDDNPGRLHPEVISRLEQPTRLQHVRNDGLPAFSNKETRRLRAAAHREVYRHEAAGTSEPTVGVLCALHVLLALGTGEPPDVLRRLTVDDVIATEASEQGSHADDSSPAERLSRLAEHDSVDIYAVSYYKARAHLEYQELYTRRDHATHRALTALIRITAGLRRESGLDSLWLLRRPRGINQAPWHYASFSLRSWAAGHGVELSEPAVYARLRKVVVTREVMADPAKYFRTGRRHSPETFFGHYTNSPVLRAHAGKLLMEGIEAAFDAAIAGPTVVTPDAEDLLAAGETVDGLAADTGKALASGELNGPQAACRNPSDSPFERPGEVCSRSMTGSCFACRNALITQHHIPAVLAMADYADPDKAADIETWQQHWKDIHETITKVILPAFPAEVVDAARARTAAVPIALGVRNDMRGPDDGR